VTPDAQIRRHALNTFRPLQYQFFETFDTFPGRVFFAQEQILSIKVLRTQKFSKIRAAVPLFGKTLTNIQIYIYVIRLKYEKKVDPMFGIGLPELIIIAIIALLVVGPKKLPELAKSLGKGLTEFKKAADDVTENIKDTLKPDDVKKEVDDFKNSLLFGKKDDQEDHTQASSIKDEANAQTPKDSANTTHS
jgi:TatA/E family protein of Tat protein translocase